MEMNTSTPLKNPCSKQPVCSMSNECNDAYSICTKPDTKQVFSNELSDCGPLFSNSKYLDMDISVEVFPVSPISCLRNAPSNPLPYLDSSKLKWSTSLHTSYADDEAVEMIDQTCTPYQCTADENSTNFANETDDRIVDESFSAMDNTSYLPCSPIITAARVKRRKKNKEPPDECFSQEILGARKSLSSVLAANEDDEALQRIRNLNEHALEFDDSYSKSFNICTPSEIDTPKTNLYSLTSKQETRKFIYPFASVPIKKPPSFLPVDQLTSSALTLEVHNLRQDLHSRNRNNATKAKTKRNELVGGSMVAFNELYDEETIKKSQVLENKTKITTAPIKSGNVSRTREKVFQALVEIMFACKNNNCDTIRARFNKIADLFVNGEDNSYGARAICYLYSTYYFLANVSLRSLKKEYVYKHEAIQNLMHHISNSFKLAVTFDYVQNLFDRFENDIFTFERKGIPVTTLYTSHSKSIRCLLNNSDVKIDSVHFQLQLLEHLTTKSEPKITVTNKDESKSITSILRNDSLSNFEKNATGSKFNFTSGGFCTASGNRINVPEKSIDRFVDRYSDIIYSQRNNEVLLADKQRCQNKRDATSVTSKDVTKKPSLSHNQRVFQTSAEKSIDVLAKPPQESNHSFSDLLGEMELEFDTDWKSFDGKLNENTTSGFKTCSGKTINIDDKFLQKSKNLFSDISVETDCNVDRNGNNALKKSEGIAASGFKMCSGKTIKVDNKLLQKSRNLFSDIADQLEVNIDGDCNSAFKKSDEIAASGFETCSGRTINVDNKLLQKSRNLFSDISDLAECSVGSNSNTAYKKPIENQTPGFKTGSGKTINVDNKLLQKSRNLFSDISDLAECSVKNNSSSAYKNPIENTTPGFKTGSGKTINVDNELLQKSRNLFSDISDQAECSIKNNSNSAYKKPIENTTPGFKTCSGKTINVDNELLLKSRNLFLDISDQTECSVGSNSGSAYKKPIENTTPGFKTCSGKTINVDSTLLQKSRNLFSDISDQAEVSVGSNSSSAYKKPIENTAPGFKTCSGKTINVDSTLLQKSKNLFSDISDQADCSTKNNSSSAYKNPIDNTTPGFKTCSGKTMNVDKLLQKSRNLFSNISDPADCSIKKKSSSAYKNPIENATTGFKTCSGKTIKVDDNLLHKSKNLFSDISEQTECNFDKNLKDTCKKSDKIATSSFKTCSGQTINVDNKTSELSKNLFSDLLNDEKIFNHPDVFANAVNTFNAGATKTSTPVPTTRSRKKIEGEAEVKHEHESSSLFIQNQSFDLVKEITETTSAFLYDISSEQSGSSFFIPNDTTANLSVKSVTENHKRVDVSDTKIKSRSTSPVLDAKYARNKRRSSTRKSGGAQSLNITFVRKTNTSDSGREQRDKSSGNACAELDTFKMNFSFKSSKRKSNSLENLQVVSKKSKADSRGRESSWPQDRIGLAIQQERYVSNKPKEFCRPTRGYYSTLIYGAAANDRKAPSEDDTDGVIGGKGRISLRQLARYEPPRQYSYDEYLKLGLLPVVIRMNSQDARRFKFTRQFFSDEQMTSGANSAISFGDTVPVILNEKNEITFEEIARGFLASPGVDPKLISREWIANHYRWIVWKLASTERFFPKSLGRRHLTLDNVLFQLKFKYEQEVDRCNRSALKRILEGDDSPARPVVLCVALIDKISSSNEYKIELTDGWYSIFAQVDEEMNGLVGRKKLLIGTKLFITGAELIGLREPCDPLQIDENVFLKFSTNSCRRVRWDTKLGFYKSNRTPINGIQTVLPKGGLISQLKAVVARVYPLLFLEKHDNATEVVDESPTPSWSRLHNEKVEMKKTMAYERDRQNFVESILSQVTNEVLKENGKTYTDDLTNSPSGQDNERLRDVIQERVQSRLPVKFSKNRHVTRLLKLRLVDVQDVKNKTSAILTIWNPCEEVTTFFKENRSYHFFNLNVNHFRNGELQLSSTRSSKYDGGWASDVKNSWFKRCDRSVDDLNKRGEDDDKSCVFDEVDVTGVIIKIKPKPQSTNYEQNGRIYVADLQQRFFALSFRVDPKNFDFGDSIESGKIVAGLNLQWKKGWLCWKIPILYVSELSSFIQSTNNASLQSSIDRIRQHFRRNNLETFVAECEAKLNGIVDSVTDASSTTSDNICNQSSSSSTTTKTPPVVETDSCNKNKSNFQSTFKNGSVACKYEKLQNYGRPPALSPIVLTSQSKVKAKLPVLRRSFKS